MIGDKSSKYVNMNRFNQSYENQSTCIDKKDLKFERSDCCHIDFSFDNQLIAQSAIHINYNVLNLLIKFSGRF